MIPLNTNSHGLGVSGMSEFFLLLYLQLGRLRGVGMVVFGRIGSFLVFSKLISNQNALLGRENVWLSYIIRMERRFLAYIDCHHCSLWSIESAGYLLIFMEFQCDNCIDPD